MTSASQSESWDEAAHGASAALLEDALFQVKRVIVGQDRIWLSEPCSACWPGATA